MLGPLGSSVNFSSNFWNSLDTTLRKAESLTAFKCGLSKAILRFLMTIFTLIFHLMFIYIFNFSFFYFLHYCVFFTLFIKLVFVESCFFFENPYVNQ